MSESLDPTPPAREADLEASDDDRPHLRVTDLHLEYALHRLRHPTLKQSITGFLRNPSHRSRRLPALRGVDFTLREGDRLGIVGRNGAGKSSLLRSIAGIYPPTRGTIETRGFLVPLFQLGLGFHAELSAAANVLQAAALLGIPQRTMRARIPAILEFAELEDYADVPIKYLSTGMAMRLAFTTATEIPPDILLLDEVFTGGDTAFRERATARMEALVDRTSIVVIVSHAMPIVRRLSNRVLWLDQGRVARDGDPDDVIAAYVAAAT
ncbi:MAG: ATP-binding cassette domain-containing protein [Myxococcota bacterium]